ncbi:hypothetical protein V6N13_098718 [Hibiscus sabdariffa]|uniref:Uncharacterized protein n=1 Tax=Hibiscus sabdariffa TaxID=183260 RepID=A0ABR2EEP3_9ROSI
MKNENKRHRLRKNQVVWADGVGGHGARNGSCFQVLNDDVNVEDVEEAIDSLEDVVPESRLEGNEAAHKIVVSIAAPGNSKSCTSRTAKGKHVDTNSGKTMVMKDFQTHS